MEMKRPKNYWNPINHSYKDEINDKEAAFKKWKEEYYGRTKRQTT